MKRRTRVHVFAVVFRGVSGDEVRLIGTAETSTEAMLIRDRYTATISPGPDWDAESVARMFHITVEEASILL